MLRIFASFHLEYLVYCFVLFQKGRIDTEHPVKDKASYKRCGRSSMQGKLKLIKRQMRGDMLVVYRIVNCQKRSVRRSYLAFPINQEQVECHTVMLKANEFKSDTSKIFSYMVHN